MRLPVSLGILAFLGFALTGRPAFALGVEQEVKPLIVVQIGQKFERPYEENQSGDILSTFSDNVFGSWTRRMGNDSYDSQLVDFSFGPGLKSLILNLKNGARFHNGRAINAHDIEFALTRGFFLKDSPFYSGFLRCIDGITDDLKAPPPGSIRGITILSDSKVELRFKRACPEIIHSLSLPYFAPRPREELNADLVTFRSLPIGAGPYRVDRENAAEGEYYLSRITGDGPGKILLLTGPSHKYAPDIVAAKVGSPPNFRQALIAPNSVLTLFSSSRHALVADPVIRRLFARIFDRHALVKNDAQKPTAGFSIQSSQVPHDETALQEARRDLRKAIKERRLPAKIEIPTFGNAIGAEKKLLIDEITRQMASVGIECQFLPIPRKFLDSDDASKYPFWLAWLVIDPVSSAVMLNSFRQGSPSVFNQVTDPLVAGLFLNVDEAGETASRKQLEIKLEKAISENGYGIPLISEADSFYFNPERIKSLGRQSNFLSLDLTQIENCGCEDLLQP